MPNQRETHSLSDFQRNAKAHIRRLRKSGLPTVLTVNGRASLVVQDAMSYERVLAALERAEVVEAVREGLAQAERGETIRLEDFDKRMRRKHKMKGRRSV